MSHLVVVEVSEGLATVTVNRPEVLNALNTALLRELRSALQNLAHDPAIGPDPDSSPDLNPRSIIVTTLHSYAVAGAYAVTVIVADDDGGITSEAVSVVV